MARRKSQAERLAALEEKLDRCIGITEQLMGELVMRGEDPFDPDMTMMDSDQPFVDPLDDPEQQPSALLQPILKPRWRPR